MGRACKGMYREEKLKNQNDGNLKTIKMGKEKMIGKK